MVINDVVAAGIIIIGVLDPRIAQKVYIQSDISYVSPKHYFRDVFRIISSEEQPVCNIL